MKKYILGIILFLLLAPNLVVAEDVLAYGSATNIELENSKIYTTRVESHPDHWNMFDITFKNLDTSNTSIVVSVTHDSMYKLKLYPGDYGEHKGEIKTEESFILPAYGSMLLKFEQLIPVEEAEDQSTPEITIELLNDAGEAQVDVNLSEIIQSDLVPMSVTPIIFTLIAIPIMRRSESR